MHTLINERRLDRMSFERPWHKWYGDVPAQLEYSQVPLKYQFIEWVKKQPEKPLVYFADQVFTYGEIDLQARKVANALSELGVKPGDRVSITLPNIPQFITIAHACLKGGFILVPANPLYTTPELGHQFNDSGTETVITIAPVVEKLIGLLDDPSHPLKRIIVINLPNFDVKLPEREGLYDLSELISKASDAEPDYEAKIDDIVLLLYTGGTTGVPKGCCISNANLIAIATEYLTWAQSLIKVDEFLTLCSVPLYHIYGINTQFNFPIYTGGTSIILPEITPDSIMDAFDRFEPNFWPTVPALLQALTMHPRLPQSKANAVKCILSGSAPLPAEVMRKFEEISGAKILEGYGGSETTNGISANPVHKQKIGSVGVPLPDLDVKIVDLETGTKEMPLGEPGEIIVKGPVIIKEYCQKPEETAQAFRDGWFYTGDIGYFDEEHYLYIVDRKKDMIITSGFNVYPRDIDEVLYT
ncbi:MAG: long-chain fatty acid--CoA ligase, partial [Syntrophomonadaceae bacterium]|nr:long-chain fatty acid--CoA ligase [Syntrophomonadaceae bacterium]